MDTPLTELPDLLRLRYRGAEPQLGGVAVTPVAGLLAHRSVRKYADKKAPSGTVELLVAAAQSAPSSSNLQLWSVVSVEDPERRAKLAAVASGQAHVRESAIFLVWLADLNRATVLARSHGIEPIGLDYLEMFLMASVDAALAAQNAVVAAEANGLGTVYIGALRNHPEAVAEILQLPPHVFAVFGLCVGYAEDSVPTAVKPRLPQAVVLGRDSYARIDAEQVRAYDQRMTEFYLEQGMNVPNGGWSLHSAERVRSAAALNGRDRLVAALQGLGFALR